MANGGRFHCGTCFFNDTLKKLHIATENKQEDHLKNLTEMLCGSGTGYYCNLMKHFLKGHFLETICKQYVAIYEL